MPGGKGAWRWPLAAGRRTLGVLVRSAGLLLVLALLLPPTVHAACPPDGVRLFPSPGAVVPTNSRFLLEGVGAYAERVAGLPGRVLRLQTQGHEIEVKVQRGWTSALGRSTVILKPSEPLRAGLDYTLRLDDVLPLVKVINASGASLPGWRGGRGPDVVRPRWLKQPSVIEGLYRRTPEGTERFAKLRMPVAEDSSAYVVVTLSRRGEDMAPQHYFTQLQDGVALVGHDACGGGFTLEEGKSYRAKVEVIDAVGNTSAATAPLQFEAPVTLRENP